MKYGFKNKEGVPYTNIFLEVKEPNNIYEQSINDKIFQELEKTLNNIMDNILNGDYIETPRGIIFNPNKIYSKEDIYKIIAGTPIIIPKI